MKQTTERLSPVQRELFFFRLHLKRLDVTKIRKRITNGILSKFIELVQRWSWVYLAIPVATYLVQHLAAAHATYPWLANFSPLGATLDVILLICHWLAARTKELSTPAKLEFADLVAAPDYDAKLGFIHQVNEDLKNTLELVNPASRPIVVFIDDLDRCSPSKVCAVVEAVNLFLAGEIEHCIFILGIDDEVVAAALNKAHADVFGQMPAYARASSIGWRFMDKFVQLPFIMPPPTEVEMSDYARSLLLCKEKKGALSLSARQKLAASVEKSSGTRSVQTIVEDVNRELKLGPAQMDELAKDAETIAKMDADIREFNDDEQSVAKVILAGVQRFSRNPRDIKRFVNSFRFYYFLRSALLTRHPEAPSIDQLSRWILLSLRWPGIVRWLRSASSISENGKGNGLSLLERMIGNSDHSTWSAAAASLMGLDEKDRLWLSDRDLFAFFKAEYKLPESEKLASSLGKGLW